MCSIAGSFERKEVEGMLGIMKHRAPDGSGIVETNGFFMGMGRLAIIDLESPGLCPIVDGEEVLVFNGELYNYQELKEELIKLGYEFNTKSDSEVVLKAYKAWGAACLDKFNFMGAFAISGREGIFAARDIAGEKPFYFSRHPFRFASEAKALGWNCEELPPASVLRYDLRDKRVELSVWWHYPQRGTYNGSYEDALRQLDTLLEDSVRLRTHAHVPYGLYFSGGIDSTLISTYHNFEHRFTYKDGEYRDEFLTAFPKILWHLDYPVKTFSPFGLWKLAEEASKEVKVVLSGEGADELFGGYVRFVGNEFNRRASKAFPSYAALFPHKDMLHEEFVGNMRELLRMGDRMAAAFGIENRCPFLDRRIIEFAVSLPMEWKVRDLEGKVILRDLLKQRKPDYQFEEKKGLYVKVNEWLGEKNPYDKETYWKYQMDLWKKMI